ncbi:MAG: rhomboid family intramembrane serine protease [Defluviimonas sp.]|nr:rhomboid family intramembrane serine protease [Defluviimonas sp.]
MLVWAIVLACVLPELVLSGADYGLWGRTGWRDIAFSYGAFWTPLLRGATPLFPGQAELMFLSHGFLHAGLVHLLFNMMTLVSLGGPLCRRFGTAGFALLYLVSLVGGGLGFAVLSDTALPMIGASGALFGLAGAWLAVERSRLVARGLSVWPVIRATIWIIALNVVMWLALMGFLAWQAHLGGFVAGWLAGMLAPVPAAGRQRSPHRPPPAD